MAGSNRSRKDKTGKKDNPYWHKCLFCGGSDGVISEAHIINAVTDYDYSAFGKAAGYEEDLDPQGPRNYIPLCGTKGDRSSCHHHYDSNHVAILWHPFQQYFYLHCPSAHQGNLAYLHGKRLPSIPKQHMPYKRLLVGRAYKCALLAFDPAMIDLPNITVNMDTASQASGSVDFSTKLQTRKDRFSADSAGSKVQAGKDRFSSESAGSKVQAGIDRFSTESAGSKVQAGTNRFSSESPSSAKPDSWTVGISAVRSAPDSFGANTTPPKVQQQQRQRATKRERDSPNDNEGGMQKKFM